MAQDFSRHHIVPRSVGGTNSKENLVRLTHKYHIAFHQVFMNQPPHEQIERILNIGTTALTTNFKQAILSVLNEESDFIYQRGILIKK